MVYIKTYISNHFYEQYLVLLTMVHRNSSRLLRNTLRLPHLEKTSIDASRRHNVVVSEFNLRGHIYAEPRIHAHWRPLRVFACIYREIHIIYVYIRRVLR